MCLGQQGPGVPAAPPLAPEAAQTPTPSAGVAGAADSRRKRAAAGKADSSILTGTRGIADGQQTTGKQLFGQ